ncbi:MAG: hypothetical protein Kow00121_03930 [Elainellaceae cyanobacterium]
MYSKTPQNGYGSRSYESEPKWREASRCSPNDRPYCPPTKPPEVIREKETKETYFLLNSAQSEQRNSESFSKLGWILLGLATLLFLGSILGNLFMVWTLARSTNNSNSDNSREVINTTTTTREVVRVIEDPGYGGDEYYYYAPPARW